MSSPSTEAFANRLRKRERHLTKWAKREGISCYRVYDKDIPEVPLAVDRYGARLHVAEYARKGFEPLPTDVVEALVTTACATLEVPREHCYIKQRRRQRGTEQYERVAQTGAVFEVEEGGLRFWVNLSDYLDTGLFLDHRQTRSFVRDAADGQDVLNLFAYTGSFSVYAADGGARTTTTVDMSRNYLTWARDNLDLNGFSEQDHRCVRADILKRLPEITERYGLIIVDPPTFSNSKRMDGVFDIQRDHEALLRQVHRLLLPGGVACFSTNHRRFKPAPNAFAAFDEAREITADTIPPDYRNARIHRCWWLVR